MAVISTGKRKIVFPGSRFKKGRALPDSDAISTPGRNRETAEALYGAGSATTVNLGGQAEVLSGGNNWIGEIVDLF
jgi:hypothetical protein